MTNVFNQSGQTVGVQINAGLPKEKTGDEFVAEAMDDFDRWEKMIGDDMPDMIKNCWDATPMFVKVYFYNREVTR